MNSSKMSFSGNVGSLGSEKSCVIFSLKFINTTGRTEEEFVDGCRNTLKLKEVVEESVVNNNGQMEYHARVKSSDGI